LNQGKLRQLNNKMVPEEGLEPTRAVKPTGF
jgi:hypothetical protein